MRKLSLAACLVIAAVVTFSSIVTAAPSLDIRKPPVTPNISWTGPPGDPHSTWGQWFKDKATGIEQWRPREFYDNLLGSGGGNASTNAIKGVVNNVGYAGGPGTNILSFSIYATITNDTNTQSGTWDSGNNRHSENLSITYRNEAWMYDVKLTASFAVDANILPLLWQGPYRQRTPYIIAQNYDELAWYCWTPNNPLLKQPYGAYYIPTYDFGTIIYGQSVSRTLSFTVPGAGLPNTDSRYGWIISSYLDGYDIFLNRTKSLKCSDWIDDLALDTGAAYPSSPPNRTSDVSVFHEHEMKPRDWGDAPDGPYPTWAINGGANHIILEGLNLGPPNDIDGEADGQPTANADGDDLNGSDENGVIWNPPYTPGQVGATVTVIAQVPVGTTGLLDAWIDFNNDGVWDNTAGSVEKIAAAEVVVTGPNVITFDVPNNAVVGQTFARFRLSTIGNLPPTGMAKDGEVEDYTCFIEQGGEPEYDFGDAPEGALAYPATGLVGQFPTCINVGPPLSFIQHTNFGGWFGQFVDFEADGNAGLCPLFNPNSYNADECFNDGDAGLLFPKGYTIQGAIGFEAVVPCVICTQPLSLGNTCQTATWGANVDIWIHNWMPNHDPYVIAYVNVLMDWDQNGVWGGSANCPTAAAPEHVLVDWVIPAKYDGPLSNLLPPGFLIGPNAGYVWTRFSITERQVGAGWDGSGSFEDGETEDYLLLVDGPDRGTLTFSKFKDIKDHFWWKTDPDLDNEMMSLTVAADAVEAIDWNGITLTLAGGVLGDVAQIDVWLDNNANGVVDAGDTNIGSAVLPVSPVTIPLGPPAVTTIPAGGSVNALVSYQLSLAAPIGNVYSFQVTGATGTGQTSGLPALPPIGLPISSCNKTVAPSPITIGEAKLLQPVGSTVFLKGKEVTAVFGIPPSHPRLFYIEEKDRPAGIGVEWPGPLPPVAQGDTISLLGTTFLLNGTELVIQYTDLLVGPNMLPHIKPVGMNNKWTGGGWFGIPPNGQPAVYDQAAPLIGPLVQSVGLSNVGMLVRTWGRVTYEAWPYVPPPPYLPLPVSGPIFWIDDGSNLRDGFPIAIQPGWTQGVACFYGFCLGTFPNVGEYWGVTGIMRAIPNSNPLAPVPVRLLVPRSDLDLTQYPMPP